MKCLLYSFILLLLPAAQCAQNIDTLYHSNGNIFKIIEQRDAYKKVSEFSQYGKPLKSQEFINEQLNGLSKTYASTGKLEIEENFTDNLRNGKYLKYSNNGNLQQKLNYTIVSIDGEDKSVLEGLGDYYHYNGKIAQSGRFRNDLREGLWLFYNNFGIIQGKVHYHKGKLSGKKEEYHANGLLRSVRHIYEDTLIDNVKYTNMVDGVVLQYYDNGNKQSEEEFKLGKSTGNLKRWRQDGQLSTESKFLNDTSRVSRSYDINGKLTLYQEEKVTWVNGYPRYLPHGKVERYIEGQLTSKEHYIDGKRNGPFETYFSNGKLASKGYSKNDKWFGHYNSYHENGKLKEDFYFSEITNWNGSTRIEQTGWQKRFNEEGKVIFETYANEQGGSLYQGYYTEDGRLYRRAYNIERHRWEVVFYENGIVRSETFSLGIPHLEERFFINGSPYLLRYRDQHNADISVEWYKDAQQIKISGSNTKVANYETYFSEPSSFDLYKTNLKNKTYKTTYLSKKPRIEVSFKDKLIENNFKLFYPNGQLALFAQMEASEIGELFYQLNLKGDTLMYQKKGPGKSKIYTYRDGANNYQKSILDSLGKEIFKEERYSNGQQKALIHQKKGINKTWMEDGTLTTDKRLVNKDSNIYTIKTYYENGQLYFDYTTRDGVKEGQEEVYFKNGQLSTRCSYTNGLQDGYLISYFEDGRLRLEGTMKKGEKEGWWKINRGDQTETEFYKNGRISVAPDTSHCACQDTARAIGSRGYIPTLNFVFKYRNYKRYNFDFLLDLDSTEYSDIFASNIRQLGTHGNFEISMFKKLRLPFASGSENHLVINACQTKGFYNTNHLFYRLDEKNYHREITFHQPTFDFVFHSSFANQNQAEDQISLRISTNRLGLNSVKHVEIDVLKSTFCFDPISIGNISIDHGSAMLVGHMSLMDFFSAHNIYHGNKYIGQLTDEYNTENSNILTQESIDALKETPVTGVYFTTLESRITYLKANFKLKSDLLIINDVWTGGVFYLAAKFVDSKSFEINDEESNAKLISIKELEKALKVSGLQHVQLDYVKDQNMLRISFINIAP